MLKFKHPNDTKAFLIGLCASLTGVILWIIYGLFIGSISVTIANFIAAIFQSIIIYYKLKLK